jgi:hypothetical protein
MTMYHVFIFTFPVQRVSSSVDKPATRDCRGSRAVVTRSLLPGVMANAKILNVPGIHPDTGRLSRRRGAGGREKSIDTRSARGSFPSSLT